MIGNFSPEKIAQLRKKAAEAKLKKNAQVRPEIVIPEAIEVKQTKPLILQAHRTGLFEISPERVAELKAQEEVNKKKKEEVKPVVVLPPKPEVKPPAAPHKGRFGFVGIPVQFTASKVESDVVLPSPPLESTVNPTPVLPHKGRFGFAGLTPAQAAALKAKPVIE